MNDLGAGRNVVGLLGLTIFSSWKWFATKSIPGTATMMTGLPMVSFLKC